MDICLQIDEHMDNFECFDPEEVRYAANWKWIEEGCNDGYDLAEAREMLR
jgi:hypothetical protein